MKNFTYNMPTQIVAGHTIFKYETKRWKSYGTHALIVTGKNSARVSGALEEVVNIITVSGQTYIHFDEVNENPETSMIDKAAKVARDEKVDFIVAIGGGSAMDTAKVVSAMVLRPSMVASHVVNEYVDSGIPVICVPTTAGTGSEVTPFAVVTLSEEGGKKTNTKTHIYPKAAWLDARFTKTLGSKTRKSTMIDAMCQSIEGYLTTRSTPITDALALDSLCRISTCREAIADEMPLTDNMLESMLYASCISGLVISQAGISLPHVLSYNLTDEYNLPHGDACGLLLAQYLSLYPDKEKVSKVLNALRFASIDELSKWIIHVLGGKPQAHKEELNIFADNVIKQTARLNSFPLQLSKQDIFDLYSQAVLLV